MNKIMYGALDHSKEVPNTLPLLARNVRLDSTAQLYACHDLVVGVSLSSFESRMGALTVSRSPSCSASRLELRGDLCRLDRGGAA